MPVLKETAIRDQAAAGKMAMIAHLVEVRCIIAPDRHIHREWVGMERGFSWKLALTAKIRSLGWKYLTYPERGWICPDCRMKQLGRMFRAVH